MAAEHWFRWHHGTVTDPKWRIVAKRASHALSRNVTVGHVVSIWAAMLENASQASPRGELSGWCDEDIAVAFDMDEAEVCAIREAMQGKTLEGEVLSAWNIRQIKREDESAADRKRAQREREKAAGQNKTRRDNGECHALSRNVPLETETETEKKDQEIPPADAAGQSAGKKKASKSVTLKTWLASLGDEDAIPAADPLYAYADSINLPSEFIALAWGWFKQAMDGKKKTDWRAHFRNAVKGNWPKYWWPTDDGGWRLSPAGEQAKRAAEAGAE